MVFVASKKDDLKKWLVRRVECIRGEVEVEVNILPAFNYAQDKHTTEIGTRKCEQHTGEHHQRVLFSSASLNLQLDATIDCGDDPDRPQPVLKFEMSKEPSELGDGVTARFTLTDGQAVSFMLRETLAENDDDHITTALVDQIQKDTQAYWFNWISQSKYKGRWREAVSRSLMILKLLTFEPTGAIIAAPTFSLPEDIGGGRNWDYRFCWIRDSSFTIYILLRMGFKSEAEAYMNFISDRFQHSLAKDGALPIMFSIRGETDLPEIELTHLEGYRGSKPVRIGNGAAFHKQLDIYGELLDVSVLLHSSAPINGIANFRPNSPNLSQEELLLTSYSGIISVQQIWQSNLLRSMGLYPRNNRIRLHPLEGRRHVHLGSARPKAKLCLLQDNALGRHGQGHSLVGEAC